MPRIPPSLLHHARALDPLLPPLLPTCRSPSSALRELRWLREHVATQRKSTPHGPTRNRRAEAVQLRRLVQKRARGVPLQYVLGSEWFGELEIRCREGVLIPRQDTATAISHLTTVLRRSCTLPHTLRVLDLCTGTGCIPLLLAHELGRPDAGRDGVGVSVEGVGIDISGPALRLARDNVALYSHALSRTGSTITIMQGDVLAPPFSSPTPEDPSSTSTQSKTSNVLSALARRGIPHAFDVLTANPPYISPLAFRRSTARSVRLFEPRLALVPLVFSSAFVAGSVDAVDAGDAVGAVDERVADAFYAPILRVAERVRAKVVLLEVADWAQAERVARLVGEREGEWDGMEVWRDEMLGEGVEEVFAVQGAGELRVRGAGEARVVVCWRGVGWEWIRRSEENIVRNVQ